MPELTILYITLPVALLVLCLGFRVYEFYRKLTRPLAPYSKSPRKVRVVGHKKGDLVQEDADEVVEDIESLEPVDDLIELGDIGVDIEEVEEHKEEDSD